MSFLALKSSLSVQDRIGRRRLMLADSVALLTLFAVTCTLAVCTNYLYQSYASHQEVLASRWLARGETALRANKPAAAIDALSSSLAFDPGKRSTAIKLAQALASAGRTQEAKVYFETLLESEQGSGLINLELARLAVKQGSKGEAIEDYHRAIYGNWEGDGYVRRRDVRFELIDYFISQHMLDQAQSELLVAEGNAPQDDISVQLDIARTMEQAEDPGDALHLYRIILRRHASLREAQQGAGRTAFAVGRFLEAKKFLTLSLEGTGVEQDPAAAAAQSRDLLKQADRALQLYPTTRLAPRETNARILAARQLSLARLAQCAQDSTRDAGKDAAAASAPSGSTRPSLDALKNFASRLARRPNPPAADAAATAPPADPLQHLTDRWQQLPPKINAIDLQNNPDLAQTQVQLIYDTALTTHQVCGEATGDNALLYRIAQNPTRVEVE